MNGFDLLITEGEIIDFLFVSIIAHDNRDLNSVIRLSKAVLELLYCTSRSSFESYIMEMSSRNNMITEVYRILTNYQKESNVMDKQVI